MQSLERLIVKGIYSLVLFFTANIFLFFIDKEIPINIFTILFAVIFGWPAILIMVIAIFFL